MQSPNNQDLPVNTRTRANILWNLQRDISQTVGSKDWQPFQEKVGVFGMRKRIKIMPGFYMEIGIVARAIWQRFDMTTRREHFRNLGRGVFIDESLTYQAYFRFAGQKATSLDKMPRVMVTSRSHTAVLRALKKFLNDLNRAI
jgi:hypothetical protein